MDLKKLGKSWRITTKTLVMGAMLLMAVNVSAQDGTVTLSQREVSIRQSLNELQHQTGYNVIVDGAALNLDKRILLSATQLSSRALLTQLLAGTHCSYTVSGDDIIILGAGTMTVEATSGPRASSSTFSSSGYITAPPAGTQSVPSAAHGVTTAAPTVAATVIASLAEVNAEAVMFNFRVNRTDLEVDYMNNRQMFAILNEMLKDKDKMALIDYVTITASASPEGYTDKNMKLSQGRANAMKGYLVWKNIPVVQDRIITYPIGEDWDGLKKMVNEDPTTPFRDEVLTVLNSAISSDAKREELKKIGGGRAYSYIKSKMLPHLRGVGACIIYFKSSADAPETSRSVIDQREALRREIAYSTPGVNSGVGVRPIATPENVTARVSSQTGNAVVSWTPVVGAVGYYYQIGDANSKPVYTTATSVNIPRNADGSVPNVRVMAVAPEQLGIEDSPYSNWTAIVEKVLPTPRQLNIESETPTTAKVSWAPVNGAIGYAVQIGDENTTPLYTTNPYINIPRNSDGTTPKVRVMAVSPSNSDTKSSPYSGWENMDVNVLPIPPVKKYESTGPTTAQVIWEPVQGAKGYYVQVGDENSTPIYTANPYYTVQKSADGTIPKVRVQAVPKDGDTVLASPYTGWIDPNSRVLPTPENLGTKSSTPNTTTVSWSPVSNAKGYYIQIGDENAKPVYTPTASFVVPKNSDGTTPKVRVLAAADPTTDWKNSPYSNWLDVDQGILPTPEHLASEGTTNNRTAVSWEPVQGAVGYYVQTGNENTEPIYTTDPRAIIDQQDGHTPMIRVSAVAGDNSALEDSPYTPWMNVDQLPAPVNIAKYGTTPDQRRSDISWSPVAGAAGYLVQPTDENTTAIYTKTNSITINNNPDGTTPQLRVKAIAPEGGNVLNSEWSLWRDVEHTYGSRVDTVYIYRYIGGVDEEMADSTGKKRYFALRTNLLYDVALLPDLFVEFSLGHRWSLSVGGQWSWWNTEDENRWFHRIQLGTVEIRKWLGSSKTHNTLNGWYIGAYGTYGTYDLQFEKLLGISSHGYLSNSTWSAGLSLGYSTPIARRWNLDFGVAVGYVSGDYKFYHNQRFTDCYHHYPVGDGTINGIYPTRAQISLVYLIGSGKNKTKAQDTPETTNNK